MKSLCVSLETAKKLKAAGWTKPTAFAWVQTTANGWMVVPVKDIVKPPETILIPACTAEEVLRELPSILHIKLPEGLAFLSWDKIKKPGFARVGFEICRYLNKYSFSYIQNTPIYILHSFENESLSEAAAQMWLWCVEQGHIKVVKP